MGSLFANKEKKVTDTSSSQSGSSQSNLWDNPDLQNFLQGYSQQFSNAGNFKVDPNQWQTGAANNQSSVAGGAQLQPGFGAASDIASGGLSTANINKFMSPYVQNVVDPTIAAQQQQKKGDLSNLHGSQAKNNAFGNQTGADAAYLAARAPQDQAQIAGLYNQGYQGAQQTALASQGQQLGAAGTLGSLTGAQTGANTALGGLGTNIWNSAFQSAKTPYDLYNQGVQGFTGFGNLAGQSYTGQSTGQSTMQGTQTPSTGSVVAGLAGTALSAFSDERVKENIKPVGKLDDGQIIYKYNMLGSPQTQIGLLAQEVEGHKPEAVGMHAGIKTVNYDKATEDAERQGKSGGGGITPYKAAGGEASPPTNSMLDKVLHATHHLKKMRDGGSATPPMKSRFDDGGAVGDPNGWGATVERAPQSGFGAFDPTAAGKSMSSLSSSMAPHFSKDGADPLAASQASLTQGLQSVMRPRYDDGGMVGELSYLGGPREEAPARGPLSGVTDYLSSIPKPFSTGVWEGQAPTALQRAGAALTQIGNGPFAGFGKHILEQQNMRYKDLEAERAAASLLGKFQSGPNAGQSTLAGAAAPGQRALTAAQTAHAEAGSEPAQKRIKEFEYKTQKDLASLEQLRKTESDIDSAAMYGAITAEEAEQRRQSARQLYLRTRGQIQDVTTPAPVQPIPAPNTSGTWTPGVGFTPKTP